MSVLCPKCGAAVEDGDQFCGDCGGPMVPAAASVATEPAAPKSGRGSGRRLAAGAGLLAIVALVFAQVGGYLPNSLSGWADLFQSKATPEAGQDSPASNPQAGGEDPESTPAARSASEEGREMAEPGDASSYSIPEEVVKADEGLPPTGDLPQDDDYPPDDIYPTDAEVGIGEDLPPELLEMLKSGMDGALLSLTDSMGGEIRPVLFSISSDPEGARLFINGEPQGTTPVMIGLQVSRAYEFRLVLAGFEDVQMTFDPSEMGLGEEDMEDVVAITIPMGG